MNIQPKTLVQQDITIYQMSGRSRDVFVSPVTEQHAPVQYVPKTLGLLTVDAEALEKTSLAPNGSVLNVEDGVTSKPLLVVSGSTKA